MLSFDSAKLDVIFNKLMKNGFYIDIGVRDGIHDNKTYLLYKNGWRGISIDAHPDYMEICKKVRPDDIHLTTICGPDDDNCKFRYNWRGSFSSIYNKELDENRSNYVLGGSDGGCWYGDINSDNHFLNIKNEISHNKSMSLNTIIDTYNIKNRKIDLLSIDVDGSETSVLKNFDIKKYNPTYVVIELENHKSGHFISSDNLTNNQFVEKYMEQNGYLKSKKFGEDQIWCNNTESLNKIEEIINSINNYNIIVVPSITFCEFLYKNDLKMSEEGVEKYINYLFSFNEELISFESVKYPGKYLGVNEQMKCILSEDVTLWRSVSVNDHIALELVSHPEYFIDCGSDGPYVVRKSRDGIHRLWDLRKIRDNTLILSMLHGKEYLSSNTKNRRVTLGTNITNSDLKWKMNIINMSYLL